MRAYRVLQTLHPPSSQPNEVFLIASGDLRLSANHTCWPAQAEMARDFPGRLLFAREPSMAAGRRSFWTVALCSRPPRARWVRWGQTQEGLQNPHGGRHVGRFVGPAGDTG